MYYREIGVLECIIGYLSCERKPFCTAMYSVEIVRFRSAKVHLFHFFLGLSVRDQDIPPRDILLCTDN